MTVKNDDGLVYMVNILHITHYTKLNSDKLSAFRINDIIFMRLIINTLHAFF
jgi:hypothetical protein